MTRRDTIPCLLAAASLVAGCAGPQSALAPAGDQAASVFRLFGLMLLVCGLFYGAVLTLLGWSLARGGRAVAEPWLRRGLWSWGGLIIAGLLVLLTGSVLVERDLAGARARETLVVKVTGHQWWWRIAYRDPASGRWFETANELHLPAGRTSRLDLGTADVIHSLWIPTLSGKMDLIPGRANALDVTPRVPGIYRGQCAEFCGAQHAHMGLAVVVEPPARFAAWLAAQAAPAQAPADPVARRGAQVVTQGACAACHLVRGTAATGRAGPDLTHVASRQSLAAGLLPMGRGALQGWIGQPQALKPGTMMPAVPLDAADLNAAAHYLETLR
ncbi:cytochrome c oxidase subunit II [Sphingomonas morindae]|uniref:C-type cytochrome n=1 Tax=Sphingomonas morindae TaxID=1541170 RepID=A0ABY4X637_9SPHN|nr:c-type cytochrome [Sphingomonas morindae]USI72336.1 c-type cytochrome [Sphingomonas morindae]